MRRCRLAKGLSPQQAGIGLCGRRTQPRPPDTAATRVTRLSAARSAARQGSRTPAEFGGRKRRICPPRMYLRNGLSGIRLHLVHR
jgi:hypothetical protein